MMTGFLPDPHDATTAASAKVRGAATALMVSALFLAGCDKAPPQAPSAPTRAAVVPAPPLAKAAKQAGYTATPISFKGISFDDGDVTAEINRLCAASCNRVKFNSAYPFMETFSVDYARAPVQAEVFATIGGALSRVMFGVMPRHVAWVEKAIIDKHGEPMKTESASGPASAWVDQRGTRLIIVKGESGAAVVMIDSASQIVREAEAQRRAGKPLGHNPGI